ncbi:type II methionyl aminopeptidase [Candidatus Micrarchaeota archaeon CG1_02_47_40]|nr:MAG: type II methionyl aminopeptidase [Candidatus Micrarchaeota archaeon CG1_02_47_40]
MLSFYEQAGKIAFSIREESKKLIMPGASYLDIAETIEKMISDAAGKPAFPVNVSVNEIAAHLTPEADCPLLLGERDMVKVDFGVHINGCIADVAYTIDLSEENGKQIDAAQNALSAAISSIRPGKKTGEIGKAIEDEIRKLGFKPIENLTGHMLQPYVLHAGPEIPNIAHDGGYEIREGDFFAIEPFASTGKGQVHETDQVEIFQILQAGNTRLRTSRQVLSFAAENFLTLPFAQRWLVKKFTSKLLLSASLKEMMNLGILYPYPVLSDEKGSLVSQAETTIVVEHDGARPLVKV